MQCEFTNSIDFHCHGIGKFDFTEISKIDLHEIDNILKLRNQRTLLTLYLPKNSFDDFLDFMSRFDQARNNKSLTNILGIGLEGPLLASHGGTPETGVWLPEEKHWEALSACGKKGLIYIIFSPDAYLPGSNFSGCESGPSITWITELLLSNGVLPTPGHFTKLNPYKSAELLQLVFDLVEKWGYCPTITDHLFNDMPKNFKHAWRTDEEKLRREQEISQLNLDSWSLRNLDDTVGAVPAVIIRNAIKGVVKICQNFDGEHVDPAIIKKTVELVGAENILMMTDSIESSKLGGRKLHMHEGSTLLYQSDNIVAAGSQASYRQILNMQSFGFSNDEISCITKLNPEYILKKRQQYFNEMTHDQVNCI